MALSLKGSPGEAQCRSWQTALQGELKDGAGHLSPPSAGFFHQPRARPSCTLSKRRFPFPRHMSVSSCYRASLFPRLSLPPTECDIDDCWHSSVPRLRHPQIKCRNSPSIISPHITYGSVTRREQRTTGGDTSSQRL